MRQLVLGTALIVGSLFGGRLMARWGRLDHAGTNRLVRIAVKGMAPFVLGFSLWGMDRPGAEVWVLPVLGVVLALLTLPPAWYYARRQRYDAARKGSFLTCAFFSNVGYFGAFIAFAVYGEAAYALCILYMLLFTPTFYTLGFWLAARYGRAAENREERSISRELRLLPLAGMAAGIALNLAGVPRPPALGLVNQWLIPVYTASYLIAIGSQLHFELPRGVLGACAVMAALKFVYTPLLAWGACELLGLEGMMRTVVILEASTPVAVSPLLFPLLFGLDRHLSNALWWTTTAVAIPWFVVLIGILPAS